MSVCPVIYHRLLYYLSWPVINHTPHNDWSISCVKCGILSSLRTLSFLFYLLSYEELMENTRVKGNRSEDLAADYLISKGFRIICRQFRIKIGEIDCIAYDTDGTLVFIEVKSSFSTSLGHPLTWITPSKQKTLAKVARIYMLSHNLNRIPCRFDAISIIKDKIEHIRNAFLV